MTKDKNLAIDKIAEKYREELKGLTKNEQKLYAYRCIIELEKNKEYAIESLKKIGLEPIDMYRVLLRSCNKNVGFLELCWVSATYNNDGRYKRLYTKSLNSYKRVLENYKLLAQELKLESALELSHLFAYMLWNGYYSVTKEHCYKLQDRLLLPGMESFDVIKGQGVCLAYAELLHNYLDACNKTSALLHCKVPSGKNAITYDYRPQINRTVGTTKSAKMFNKIIIPLLSGVINKTGNHAVTLIEENDKMFVYDPTNFYALNVIDESKATIINGNGSYDIKPFSTLVIIPNSDPNKLFEKLVCGNITPAFDRKEFIFSFENVMELIKNNISLLDDAYDNIHHELEVIDNQTDEISGLFKSLKKQNK